MSRYFFDVDDGEVRHDDRGVELINLDIARNYAVRVAQDCAGRYLNDGQSRTIRVSVRDPSGYRIFAISMICAVEQGTTSDPAPS